MHKQHHLTLRLFQASIHLLAKLKSRQFTRLNCFLSLNLLPRVQESCNVKKNFCLMHNNQYRSKTHTHTHTHTQQIDCIRP